MEKLRMEKLRMVHLVLVETPQYPQVQSVWVAFSWVYNACAWLPILAHCPLLDEERRRLKLFVIKAKQEWSESRKGGTDEQDPDSY